MKNIIVTLSLLTALSLPAFAEDEAKERPERPDPAQVAAQWIADFDANSNGALEEAELIAAFESAQKNRPQRPQMGRRGQATRGAQEGERPERPERPERTEREPGQMITNLIERFDKNDDQALNDAELKEALTAMNKMRGARGQRGPGGRGPGPRPQRPAQG
jgi:hypothetical protein